MEQLTIHRPLPPAPQAAGEGLLRAHATLQTIPRQGLVYSPGEAPSHLYLVEQGEVRLSRITADGRELTLELAGPGELFGELEILLRRPRECQAQARGECTLWALERGALGALVERDAGFGRWLTERMGERQSRMQERLETLLFKSANGKVAQVLLELAGRYGRPTGAGTLIDYPITHQEIGNLIATTRETVSYAFMDLRQRGLISTRQRRTIILDADELEELAIS
jgi:CRP-like cAMP-binding protein